LFSHILQKRIGIIHSFLNFLRLLINIHNWEMLPLWNLIHICYIPLIWYKNLSVVLKDELLIFIIKPKHCDLGSCLMFDNPNRQSSLITLSKSKLFSTYPLLIVNHGLFLLFSFIQLFLIMSNDLYFFVQRFWVPA